MLKDEGSHHQFHKDFLASDLTSNIVPLSPYVAQAELAQQYPFLFGPSAHLVTTTRASIESANSAYIDHFGRLGDKIIYGNVDSADPLWMPINREIFRFGVLPMKKRPDQFEANWEVHQQMIRERRNGQEFARISDEQSRNDFLLVNYQAKRTLVTIPEKDQEIQDKIYIDRRGRQFINQPTDNGIEKVYTLFNPHKYAYMKEFYVDRKRNIATLRHTATRNQKLTEVTFPIHIW